MLHELGHGVYDLGFDDGLPWLLREHAPRRDRGLRAPLRLARRPARVARDACSRSTPREAEELDARLRRARAADLLVFTRWVLVMTAFERALYADPDERPGQRSGGISSARYQLRHAARRPHAPDWAAKIHIAVAPVYYHTYLYGSIVASQLRAALAEEAGGLVDRPGGRRAAARAALRARRVDPLGPARRAGLRLAALGRVARPRSRRASESARRGARPGRAGRARSRLRATTRVGRVEHAVRERARRARASGRVGRIAARSGTTPAPKPARVPSGRATPPARRAARPRQRLEEGRAPRGAGAGGSRARRPGRFAGRPAR